jgi:hypothetical protein
MTMTHRLLLMLALGLAACGGRALPEVDAAAGASPTGYDVTRALREDPPLPGAKDSGWDGLEGEAPAADPHAHHRHGADAADPHAHHRHGADAADPHAHHGHGGAAPKGSATAAPSARPVPSAPAGGGGHAH